MKDETSNLLEEYVASTIEDASNFGVGSPEHQQAIENVNKITARLIELDKNNSEYFDKYSRTEMEKSIKEKELTLKKKELDSRLKLDTAKAIGEITLGVGGLVTYWIFSNKSLAFEKVDNITSTVGKSLFQKLTTLLPIKK